MKTASRFWSSLLPLTLLCGLFPLGKLFAQQEKIAALKQSIAENQKRLHQYKWVETTVVKMKGEEKSRTQKMCFYGPDGKVQKQQISAPPPPPPQQSKGGMKGKIVAKKKEELTEYMQKAVGLVHQYVPPDPQRIEAVRAAGGSSISPMGPGGVRVDLHNYLKNGDGLSLNLDTGSNSIQTISVKSYLEKQEDAITLSVTFARMGDGLSYPANIVLSAPEKNLEVAIQNSNYQSLAPPAPAPASASGPATGIDSLTGPIALYPDALIAQILTASTDPAALQKFAGWMQGNANLNGSALQDAAQGAGFDACYIALAPFPQVIQMMAGKPDWTKQLGQAFSSDKQAVFDSIQRLRAKAQAVGNLKSTPQQEVQAQTTSGGQQVIVIQPANPQVVYVPQYNPQTVYISAPPPPPPSGGTVVAAAAIGFTAGIIIGSSSNHYYHGPYAWHGGGAMYHEAWEQREDYMEHRQDHYQQNSSQRQSASQQNQAQRQSAAQSNQAQRQSAAQAQQPQAQANQAQRQSTAQTAQANAGNRQAQAQATGGQRQSATATSSRGGGQAAAQRSGTKSSGFSGYQSGGAARAQSERGNRSRSGGGRSGGRR